MRADLTLLALGALGCAVNLDPDAPRPPAPHVESLHGCLPAPDRVESLEGRVDTVTLAGGETLVIASHARFNGKDTSAGFRLGDSASTDDCLTGLVPLAARPIIDVSGLGNGIAARPLGGTTTDATYLFFAVDDLSSFTTEGFGVARWDADNEGFVGVSMLWTGDRPSYGSAAIVDGDYVYVFGGRAARFLAADAYVARVAAESITEPAAYEYWAGGGGWTPNADEAMPLVEAGTSPSVAWDPAHERWLMAYSEPLSTDITLRSGLGVTGPWSLPVTFGRCDLPEVDWGAFCGDVTLVPGLAEGGGIAMTQGVATFARPPTATAADYWTRLIEVGWSAGLP